ncbi:MAG: 1-deoxy-D-xylulose-5-phosphate synthase [Gemmatimonadetes bacterium]|nr:1-deoxy-D-xylulose-5-phosphate synthase [Gemmatimonadota bacterium]
MRTQPSFLDRAGTPDELKRLRPEDLPELARELREEIVSVVSVNGGHFGSPLGVVELTVALHYLLDSPRDKIVWDVGHQAYAHKLLTGRRDRFHTLRMKDGLSGFTLRSESAHDPFGAAHASTAISAALGMAKARDLQGGDCKVVAVVGDGALTGGLAFEGLNNAGSLGSDILVILNDNEMSIAPNVGAIHHYLTEILTNPLYNKLRSETWKLAGEIPVVGEKVRELAGRVEESVKHLVVPGTLFEELGFRYIGPIDGHDLSELLDFLPRVLAMKGPVLLHALTKKGKGYTLAEADPWGWHGKGAFDKTTGKSEPEPGHPKYTKVFGEALVTVGRDVPEMVAITAAMPDGTGVNLFQKVFPERTFDVGIAEQHAVEFAAGLATQGIRPVCAIYSTFLQRAYDVIVHDVAIQNLPVVFAMDRAGLVGQDGPTHQGAFDLAYLTCLPNFIVAAPKDEREMQDLLYTAVKQTDHPFAFRYPRDAVEGVLDGPREHFEEIPVGTWEELREGSDVALLAVGTMVATALRVARELAQEEGVEAAVLNCRFVKPMDEDLLMRTVLSHERIVTLEEAALPGGFGERVARWLFEHPSESAGVTLRPFGIPDVFIQHASRKEQLAQAGLSADAIRREVLAFLARSPAPSFSSGHVSRR